jgi:WD40 repeat protein
MALPVPIVRVVGGAGTSGAGFVVTDDGVVATCAHVIGNAGSGPGDQVEVVVPGGGTWKADVEADSWHAPDREDIAFVRAIGLPATDPAVLAHSRLAEGADLRTYGYSAARPEDGLAGKVELVGTTTLNGSTVLQARSHEVSLGFSGAPVWDRTTGVVVGMVDSIVTPGSDPAGRQGEVAFVRPAEELWAARPELHPRGDPPYRGLEVFDEAHADDYFGRDQACAELVERLLTTDFVMVVGVSGSGKSSLVRAGLQKGLAGSRLPGLPARVRRVFRPGSAPLLDLALALGIDAEGWHGVTPDQAAVAVHEVAGPEGLLLIADQFERLFTECRDEEERRRFVDTLLALAGDAAKVAGTLRADFYGRALQYPGLAHAMQEGQLTLLSMSEDQLMEAVERPARRRFRAFEPGVPERLVADVAGRAGDLPLLQYALTELWNRDAEDGLLTRATYNGLGYEGPDGAFPGVRGAIARRAEETFTALGANERVAVRRIVLSLLDPASMDGEALAGHRAWLDEFDEPTRVVAGALAAEHVRLLTTGRDPVSGRPTVEVAHEALLRGWPRVRVWGSQYAAFVRWTNQDLTPFLRRWLERERGQDFLLPEAMLGEARQRLEQFPELLAGEPAAYVEASIASWESERERLQRMLDETERQRRHAVARQLAAQSEESRHHPTLDLSLLLAIESLRQADLIEGDRAIRRALDVIPATRNRVRHSSLVEAVALSPDGEVLASGDSDGFAYVTEIATGERRFAVEHMQADSNMVTNQGVHRLVFSPDGRLLATAGDDGWARLHEVESGRERARVKHEFSPNFGPHRVQNVAFSADGAYLATAGGESHDACVVDVADGSEVARLQFDQVWDVALNADGSLVALTCGQGIVVVDRASGEERLRLQGGWGINLGLAWFTDDGGSLVIAGHDQESGMVRTVTHVLDGSVVRAPEREPDRVREVLAVSPDGRYIATAGVSVVEASSGRQALLVPHETAVPPEVAFSGDGRFIALASHFQGTQVFDLSSGREQLRIAESSRGVALSSDGRIVARSIGAEVLVSTADGSQLHARIPGAGSFAVPVEGPCLVAASDGCTVVFDLEAAREHLRLEAGAREVALSADGQLLALVRDTVEVRRVETGQLVQTIHLPARGRKDIPRVVAHAAFASDGAALAMAVDDGTARVFDLVDGRERVRHKHKFAAWGIKRPPALAVSADGHTIATASRAIYVLDAMTWSLRARFDRDYEVEQVALSPDGRTMACNELTSMRVIDAKTGSTMFVVDHGEHGFILDMRFSPDGRFVATASRDRTARVTALEDGREHLRIEHPGGVHAVAFSPDGEHVATMADGGDVRVVDLATRRDRARLQHGGTGYSTPSLAFAAGGRFLVTADGRDVLAWALRPEDLIAEGCRRLTRNLTPDEWREYVGDQPYRKTCHDLD